MTRRSWEREYPASIIGQIGYSPFMVPITPWHSARRRGLARGRWRGDRPWAIFDEFDQAIAKLFAQPGIAVCIDDQSVVWVGAAADASFERIQGEAPARGIEGGARTERVIEPDAAIGRGCDAGDVDATVAPGWTTRRWHAIFVDTGAGIVHRLPDDELADFAGPAFAPPDVAPAIECNQMRCVVVRRGRDILLDAPTYSTAGSRVQAPDAVDLVVVLGEPDGASQRVRACKSIGVALRRWSWEREKLSAPRIE